MIEGLRLLLVEDEFPVLLLLEDMAQELGCAVAATAVQFEEALRLAAEANCDAAVLDINIAGQRVFPVASVLEERGIPILFASGYGSAGLEETWRKYPIIQKPFSAEQFAEALRRALRFRG